MPPIDPTDVADGGRLLEAVAVGACGAALAFAVGTPLELGGPLAAIGGLNGLITGWRGTYRWDAVGGPLAFVLDSTWALPMTAAGLVAQLLGVVRGRPGYDESLSRRANRQVFVRGFVPRTGFAITIGNVIAGAGDTTNPRRRRLVTDHETVHVWQARWLGPIFPLLYGLWSLGGVVCAVPVWVARGRRDRLGAVVESCAYYLNPFEWWAYSRDDHWPPSGKVRGLGWRGPIVRPLAARKAPAR